MNGNTWLKAHRDAIALTVTDWNAFRDPDAVTYGSYVARQDDQETYVEGLLDRFDADGYDASLPEPALDFLALAVTPCRYLAHAGQMLSAYVQQLAPSSYIANCATFQTADQLRRVQLIAYRTTQLARTFPERGFGAGERGIWESYPGWQPIRAAVENALVEYDWDRAVVATQLVVLQGHLDDWTEHGHQMAVAGSELLATGGGRASSDIHDSVLAGWRELIEPAGLIPAGV